MGSNLYRALLRGAPLSAPTGNTHAPGPCGMPTGCTRYLPPWPLCTVCAKKGVDNLLNRTLPAAGTSGSTKTSMGVTGTRLDLWSTQEAYVFPAWLVQQILFTVFLTGSPLIMPHHASRHILATTRCPSRGCVHRNTILLRTPSELSPGTCGMRSGYCHQCHTYNRKDFHHMMICMSMTTT